MKNQIDLFTPLKIGSLEIANRVVMAPLTRCRAGVGNVPTQLNALYYSQRATAGLIIAEATQISPEGVGYPNTPGIYNDDQEKGWKLVTDAVHAKGGKIFLQLWHVGRCSHELFQPNKKQPIGPSPIAVKGDILTPEGFKPYPVPREISIKEIKEIVKQYIDAAHHAKMANFDGIEIHGANGYLLDQFLRDGSNKRTDEYGGSEENRSRFILEVVNAVFSVWDSERVGIRLSPNGVFHDMSDSNPLKTFSYLLQRLTPLNLAYVHIIEEMDKDRKHGSNIIPVSEFRKSYPGIIIANGMFTKDKATQYIQSGSTDAVAFGKIYISNPDLVERFKQSSELNSYDESTFYGGTEKGYTDYPAL